MNEPAALALLAQNEIMPGSAAGDQAGNPDGTGDSATAKPDRKNVIDGIQPRNGVSDKTLNYVPGEVPVVFKPWVSLWTPG